MPTANPLNAVEDFLKQLEDALRGDGAWCHGYQKKGAEHYYITRNPKSSMAISLCGAVVLPIKSLSLTTPEQKCFVCDTYLQAGKERLRKQTETVAKIEILKFAQTEFDLPQPTEKE